MKKVFMLVFIISISFLLNFTFAETNPYQKTFDGRRSYAKKGLTDISSYLSETASANNKQLIKNATTTVIFDINVIIDKSSNYFNQGNAVNMSIIKKSIDKKISSYKIELKKYGNASDIDALFSDFENGMNNIYTTNFTSDNNDKTLDFQKQSQYYAKIYAKLKVILQKYPGAEYKTFLANLSQRIEQKKSKILHRNISDDKKSKYIMMYETLELVIKDFQK